MYVLKDSNGALHGKPFERETYVPWYSLPMEIVRDFLKAMEGTILKDRGDHPWTSSEVIAWSITVGRPIVVVEVEIREKTT